jgi:L-lactate dehydrogenase complex protein LldE
MIVDIFIPCFIDQIYPETGFNMVKVLEKVGCTVHYNPEQTCCGQPAFNAGYWDQCKEVGDKFIKEFQNERNIVVPSSSCVGMVRNYYSEMFHNTVLHNEFKQIQRNIFEFSEFLVNKMNVTNVGAVLVGTATYHDACSALRECNIKDEPRKLLQNVKGLELIEMEDTDVCCGFGGMFSVKYEPVAVGMADNKLRNAIATGADYIISTDASCLMHLDGYINKQEMKIKTLHIADVLASGW